MKPVIIKSLLVGTTFFLLLIPVSTNHISADLTQIELKLAFDDDDESLTNDLNNLWIGEDQNNLVIVVDYYRVNGDNLGASINMTIRDESSNIYLLRVGTFNESYFVSVSEGVSLSSPEEADNPSFSPISYGQQQVYFNPHRLELGFYVDWNHIGGQGEIDLVIWTSDYVDSIIDPETENESDIIPNFNHVVFNNVNQVDRTLDLSAAISGDFETPTTPPNDEISTNQPITRDQPAEDNNEFGVGVIAVLVLLGFVLFLWSIGSGSKPAKPKKPIGYNISKKSDRPALNSTVVDNVEMKYIPEIDKNVRMCCYQTARLNEIYCYCGRAVDPELQSIFDGNNDNDNLI